MFAFCLLRSFFFFQFTLLFLSHYLLQPIATEEERDTWSVTIRQAKAQLLVSLNVTHPHSTLASSSSTTHLRRSLQALPFPPDTSPSSKNGRGSAEIMRRKLGSGTGTASWRGLDGKGKGKHKTDESDVGKRRKVEHWLPAIWIPDEKTGACMRCGRPFGWRRRRHHCRLCGRCVCASCSGRVGIFGLACNVLCCAK